MVETCNKLLMEKAGSAAEVPVRPPGRPGVATCYTCGQEGHYSRECPTRGGKGKGKGARFGGAGGVGNWSVNITCFFCKKPGHGLKDCQVFHAINSRPEMQAMVQKVTNMMDAQPSLPAPPVLPALTNGSASSSSAPAATQQALTGVVMRPEDVKIHVIKGLTSAEIPQVYVKVGGVPLVALLDTGCTCSLVSEDALIRLLANGNLKSSTLRRNPRDTRIRGFGTGDPVPLYYLVDLPVQVGDGGETVMLTFQVVGKLIAMKAMNLIIGMDHLRILGFGIGPEADTYYLGGSLRRGINPEGKSFIAETSTIEDLIKEGRLTATEEVHAIGIEGDETVIRLTVSRENKEGTSKFVEKEEVRIGADLKNDVSGTAKVDVADGGLAEQSFVSDASAMKASVEFGRTLVETPDLGSKDDGYGEEEVEEEIQIDLRPDDIDFFAVPLKESKKVEQDCVSAERRAEIEACLQMSEMQSEKKDEVVMEEKESQLGKDLEEFTERSSVETEKKEVEKPSQEVKLTEWQEKRKRERKPLNGGEIKEVEVPLSDGKKAKIIVEVGGRVFTKIPEENPGNFTSEHQLAVMKRVLEGKMDSHLSDEERESFRQLIWDFHPVFALCEDEVVRIRGMKFEVETTAPPVYQMPFKRGKEEDKKVEYHIQKRLKDGVLKPAVSGEWSTPAFVVPKKDDEKGRMVCDYRKVNERTKMVVHPLPLTEDILREALGSEWYSSYDAYGAFNQLELTENAKEVLAVITTQGLFRWEVLPFGPKNGPTVFQGVMEKLLARCVGLFARIFIDDILNYTKIEKPEDYDSLLIKGWDELACSMGAVGDWKVEGLEPKAEWDCDAATRVFKEYKLLKVAEETFNRHLEQTAMIFGTSIRRGLTLKLTKCTFFVKSVTVVGTVLEGDKMKIDLKRVRALLDMECPGNVGEVRRFIGALNFLRGFLGPKFAEKTEGICRQLRDVKPGKKSTELVKDPESLRVSLEEIRDLLRQETFLTQPSYEKVSSENPFEIFVDASDVGMGGVLLFEGRPVAFGSGLFRGTQIHWDAWTKELYAIKTALGWFGKLRQGKPTVLWTDHKNILNLSNWPAEKTNAGMLTRWMLQIRGHHVEIKHVPGKDNVIADALSRNISGMREVKKRKVPAKDGDELTKEDLNEFQGLNDEQECFRIKEQDGEFDRVCSVWRMVAALIPEREEED